MPRGSTLAAACDPVVPQPPAAPPLTLACNAFSYTAEKWAELERDLW